MGFEPTTPGLKTRAGDLLPADGVHMMRARHTPQSSGYGKRQHSKNLTFKEMGMSETTNVNYEFNADTKILAVNGSFLFILNGHNLTRIKAGVYKMPNDINKVQMYSEFLKEQS